MVLLQIVVFVEWGRGQRGGACRRDISKADTCRIAGRSLGAMDAIEWENNSIVSFWGNFKHTSCKRYEPTELTFKQCLNFTYDNEIVTADGGPKDLSTLFSSLSCKEDLIFLRPRRQ